MSIPALFPPTSSNLCLSLDPLYQLGDARVDAGLVATRAAFPPAHNAGLEPLPTLLETRQGASRVSLVTIVRGERLYIGSGRWERDNYKSVNLYYHFVLLSYSGERVARSHLACVDSSWQESAAEHPGGDLALRDRVTYRVVNDFHHGLLEPLWLWTCKCGTKKGPRDLSVRH